LIETSVENLEELRNAIETEKSESIFRGMACSSWRLRTSMERALEKLRQSGNNNVLLSETAQNIFLEIDYQRKFMQSQSGALAKLLSQGTGNSLSLDDSNFLHLPIILQHYRYPTRVQDWTRDWQIALFFCLEDDTQVGDFALWTLKSSSIPKVETALASSEYLYPHSSSEGPMFRFYRRLVPGVYLLDLPYFTRICAQNGIALVSGMAEDMDFQSHFDDCSWINQDDLRKIVVSKGARAECAEYLRTCDITKESLYPSDVSDTYIESDLRSVESFINRLYPPET
jgi:hypothetical protein